MEDYEREGHQPREFHVIDKYEQNLPANWQTMNISEEIKKLNKTSQPNYGKQKEYMAQTKKQIDLLFEQIKLKEEKIASFKRDTSNYDQISGLITRVQDIKKELAQVSDERKTLLKQKENVEKAFKDSKSKEKSLKSGVRYDSVEEIDDAIYDLEYKHNTESLSVAQQKEILKEIARLKQSKKFVSEYQEVSDRLEVDSQSFSDINGKIKSLGEQIGKYVDEINKCQEEIEKKRQVKVVDKTESLRNEKQKLYDDVKKLREERTAKHEEFDQQIKDFEIYQELVQNLNYIKRKQDYIKRKEAEEQKTKEEIEIKKIVHPYLKEINTTIRLINYLDTLKPKTIQNTNTVKVVPSEITLSNGAVQTKLKKDDDTFGGYVTKKNKKNKNANCVPNPPSHEEDSHLPIDNTNNSNKSSKKNKNKKNKAQNLPLALSTIADFNMLELEPPVTVDDIQDCIKLLGEKKTYYENLPPVSESAGDTETPIDVNKAIETEVKVE